MLYAFRNRSKWALVRAATTAEAEALAGPELRCATPLLLRRGMSAEHLAVYGDDATWFLTASDWPGHLIAMPASPHAHPRHAAEFRAYQQQAVANLGLTRLEKLPLAADGTPGVVARFAGNVQEFLLHEMQVSPASPVLRKEMRAVRVRDLVLTP
ncbi:hypothetical protein [Ramlibacter alkalitolerans]|uniref:Uncharacterized protein n=1 Tax=Ramlibacter alkalitolerans TaxID=2039631 RepID=A0ABS1JVY8_9BURK|nr:hypothetical protein [Ramlibacter alkalitolerans]MBL0427710.1 hypothetical protein [Ramlibacter alkalitolerans]